MVEISDSEQYAADIEAYLTHKIDRHHVLIHLPVAERVAILNEVLFKLGI